MKKYTMPKAELLTFSTDLLMFSLDQSEFEGPKDYASEFGLSDIQTI